LKSSNLSNACDGFSSTSGVLETHLRQKCGTSFTLGEEKLDALADRG